MLYFAYGSNMHAGQMKERCPSAKFVCRAKLPSHRLAFTRMSVSRGCGVADILRDEMNDVWGVVYELLESQLENLDKDEDFRPGRPDDQNDYTRENCYVRSEEHTSELQSHHELVCRLLHEKKKSTARVASIMENTNLSKQHHVSEIMR